MEKFVYIDKKVFHTHENKSIIDLWKWYKKLKEAINQFDYLYEKYMDNPDVLTGLLLKASHIQMQYCYSRIVKNLESTLHTDYLSLS